MFSQLFMLLLCFIGLFGVPGCSNQVQCKKRRTLLTKKGQCNQNSCAHRWQYSQCKTILYKKVLFLVKSPILKWSSMQHFHCQSSKGHKIQDFQEDQKVQECLRVLVINFVETRARTHCNSQVKLLRKAKTSMVFVLMCIH